jgi:transcriptional regulator with XRE-family HTH domain
MSKGKTAHSPQELKAFSERLWEAMRRQGLESKADLARLLGLPDMTVGRWLESKYMPSLRHMKMLADKLNVTVDYLQGSEPMAR